MANCVHAWVLGNYVEGPVEDEETMKLKRGFLRYREAACRRCGEVGRLKERDMFLIVRTERGGGDDEPVE